MPCALPLFLSWIWVYRGRGAIVSPPWWWGKGLPVFAHQICSLLSAYLKAAWVLVASWFSQLKSGVFGLWYGFLSQVGPNGTSWVIHLPVAPAGPWTHRRPSCFGLAQSLNAEPCMAFLLWRFSLTSFTLSFFPEKVLLLRPLCYALLTYKRVHSCFPNSWKRETTQMLMDKSWHAHIMEHWEVLKRTNYSYSQQWEEYNRCNVAWEDRGM